MAAAAAGGAMALIHAFLCVSLIANQVVAGLGLTMFGMGISGLFGLAYVGKKAPGFGPIAIPGLGDIPIIGPIFFNQDLMVYFALLMVPACWYYLFKTRPGLVVRACGENPSAADAWGESVAAYRYIHVVMGGVLAGIGGAYLSLGYTHMWVENMVAGRGWIALALVIFGFWHPMKAAAGRIFVRRGGGGPAAHPGRRGHGAIRLLNMLPYVLTIVILIVITLRQRKTGRVEAPAALGLGFRRGG
jgi:ABC-type uncharacterized transport system permease subunit